jgi:hypothetical protein
MGDNKDNDGQFMVGLLDQVRDMRDMRSSGDRPGSGQARKAREDGNEGEHLGNVQYQKPESCRGGTATSNRD